ncbi:hypothetical protein HPB49_012362 [Dermacentor silvarum]|uniref:Uncharacterized protein n=1 Tax=Dermacentor silvarum TaxID=543639 RepID=A0ACB8CXC5_DERSI|nr:hypothetical protein HPB49_012362 [Dermacentor silvarum]
MFEWRSFWTVFTTWLTIIVAAILMVKSFRRKSGGQKNKLTAPGPWGVPILGYLPFLRKPYHTTFRELSKQYGPIIKFRLGCKDVLVLNDLASIREGLSNSDVLYRPSDFVFRHLGIEGIASINGEPWQVNRRYCFHVLRNLGFARKSMEKHIQEEVQCFMAVLASGKKQPMLVAHPLASSVANNISALVFGERYELGDPKGRYVEGMLSKLLREAHFFSPTDFIPALRFVATRLPNTQLYAMKSVLQELTQFIRKEVQERGAAKAEHMDKDFIDGYLRKIEENKGKDSHFTLSTLVGSTVNFYSAATNTVRSAVLWNLYIAASDPDGQQVRVQREIDSAIGRKTAPTWEDRRRTPFTMACILEALRWRTTAPLGLQRAAGRDTEICGYHVPAGTMVVANLWSLHNDPVEWREPFKYDPTRFLNADGTEMGEKPAAFLPFGTGRRQCPGETLALMEVFLYVATTLQRFRVLPEEGKTISLATAPAIASWEGNWSVILAWLAVILGGLLTIQNLTSKSRRGKDKHLPPGPKGIPLLGYLPFIWKPYHVVFQELSEKYGPIIRLQLGIKDVVVLNDVTSVREGLSNPDVLYRPSDFIFNYLGVNGIAALNGEAWLVNRRYCFHVLRNLGFAKKSMEEHIHEELECFLEFLASVKGQPMRIAEPLAASVANNISALVFGRRYDLEDPKGRFFEGLLSMFLRNANFFCVMDFIPVLRTLAYYIPNSKLRIMNYIMKELTQHVRRPLNSFSAASLHSNKRDFIDGYLRKIKENKGTTDSHYTMKYLEGNAINFYGPSTNPVRTVILWNLYIAASDPDGQQACVQREIDSIVGRQRPPEWQDRLHMPYTMASILETLRWRTSSPLSLHRVAGRDTVIGGYHVPAGTLVVPNMWSLNNDPAIWRNPSQFDPTRFLNADGTEVDEKPLAFMPFSVGRRACPGETLALMEVFLYVTTVLQKFRVLPEEGKIISLDIERALLAAREPGLGLRPGLRRPVLTQFRTRSHRRLQENVAPTHSSTVLVATTELDVAGSVDKGPLRFILRRALGYHPVV